MRTLHITSWYPNVLEPREAPFIKRHMDALRSCGEHDVWHVHVLPGSRWHLHRKGLYADRTLIWETPIGRWYLIELLTFLLIAFAWITRDRRRTVDLVNLYIAYPAGVRVTWLRRIIRRPFVLAEQWSAYHFNFHGAGSGADRARRIFHHGLPIICVSRALADDIRTFSGRRDLDARVIDNVVDVTAMHAGGSAVAEEGRFFAVSLWRRPKRPEVMLEALALLIAQGRRAHLRLGGDGPEMDNIRKAIDRLHLRDHVTLLGRLQPEQIGVELHAAHALWHCSDYETFSVVCAEALCCGTPVFASNVGGIPGFVDATNGTLIDRNEAATWAQAVLDNWDMALAIDRTDLAQRMSTRFAPATVGARFQSILNDIANRGGHTA
jgi:glycosyltransferase involved in cell wall biosynthesis